MSLLEMFKETKKGPWITIDKERDIQVRAFFDDIKRYLWLDFQGSNSKKDWQINFNFWPPICGFKIDNKRVLGHRGFIKSVIRSYGWAANLVSNYDPEIVIIRGFSQGAAYAKILTVMLASKKPKPHVCCYAFGGPPVWFWRRTVNNYWYTTTAIEHRGDPVVWGPKLFGLRDVRFKKVKIGKWKLKFWECHFPSSYEEALKKEEKL